MKLKDIYKLLIKSSFILLFCFVNIFFNSILKAKTDSLMLGIDVLQFEKFELLKNKRVALLANNASRNSNGTSTFDIFKNENTFILQFLLVPEHGYFTTIPAGKSVENDTLDGIPLISIYGENLKPNNKLMKNIDVIVIDIQDIGVRSYTYISSIFKVLESAAIAKKEVLILDRPNPLGGLIVDGNTVDSGRESFVGIAPISYIHGCTIGELSQIFIGEKWIKGVFPKENFNIVKMSNWFRNQTWEDTELNWYPTSPHVPTVNSIRGLATIGILGELGIFSIGIGTTSPFQYLGSQTFNTDKFIDFIQKTKLSGIQLSKSVYQPFYGFGSNKNIHGLYMTFDKYNSDYYSNGIKILYTLFITEPDIFNKSNLKSNSVSMFNKVVGTDELLKLLIENSNLNILLERSNRGLKEFKLIRSKYLLY